MRWGLAAPHACFAESRDVDDGGKGGKQGRAHLLRVRKPRHHSVTQCGRLCGFGQACVWVWVLLTPACSSAKQHLGQDGLGSRRGADQKVAPRQCASGLVAQGGKAFGGLQRGDEEEIEFEEEAVGVVHVLGCICKCVGVCVLV